MPQLINSARGDATINQVPVHDTSTVIVEIPGLAVSKTADMDTWIGDVLTYTIEMSNIESTEAATGVSFTDTINPTYAVLDTNSVYANNQHLEEGVGFTYVPSTGLLTIPNLPNIDPGVSYEITFQVTKA